MRDLDLVKPNITEGEAAETLPGRISHFYKGKLLRNEVIKAELKDILFRNVKHWMDNETWLSSSLVDGDRSLLAESAMDNPDFRNRVATLKVIFSNHYRARTEHQEEGAELAKEIHAFLEEE